MSVPVLRRLAAFPGRAESLVFDARNLRRLRTSSRGGIRAVVSAPLVFGLSVLTIAAGFVLLAAYLLLVANVRTVLSSHGEDLSLVVFVAAAPADPVARKALRRELERLQGVKRARFVSASQALDRLRADLGAEGGVLDSLSENPLPGSYELSLYPSARSLESAKALAAKIQGLAGVDEVRYGEAWLESYARLLAALQWLGLGFGACLLAVLGVIVAGTVRLAVFTRSDEIAIQRLVGAGGFYVRLPFFLEAMLQGLLGAALALALLFGIYSVGVPLSGDLLQRLFGLKELAFFGPGALLGVLALGALLGLGSSVLALLRLEESP